MPFQVTPTATSRLTLRPWRDDEGAALLSILGREDVNRYLFTGARTSADLPGLLARRGLQRPLEQAGDSTYLAVEVTGRATVVGEVLLVLRNAPSRSAEFGAVLHPDHHGRGYALEAGRAMIAAGFAAGLHRIYARSDARNVASVRLMTRLGMRREAHMIENEFVKGEWTDEIRCAVLAAEYPAADARPEQAQSDVRTLPDAQQGRETALTDTVLASFDGTPDARLHALVTALTRHLHGFAREVRLTEAEWAGAIDFLTAAGHITDDNRQEFILLSDVLGLSMQTITINHPVDEHITESTVLGPFFVAGAPLIDNGDDLAFGAPGEPCWVEGTVRDEHGTPLGGARLEVWEADDDGFYDVQYDDQRVAARAHLFTEPDGSYRFWALTPTPYPIPHDGPVGRLLAATGRSPMRAPHLHFMVSAAGCRTLITHIFVAGDELTADSVFGVRDSLVTPFERQPPGSPTPDGRPVDGSWTRTRFDIVLAAAAPH